MSGTPVIYFFCWSLKSATGWINDAQQDLMVGAIKYSMHAHSPQHERWQVILKEKLNCFEYHKIQLKCLFQITKKESPHQWDTHLQTFLVAIWVWMWPLIDRFDLFTFLQKRIGEFRRVLNKRGANTSTDSTVSAL